MHELEALHQVETGKLRELELNDPEAGVRQAQADVDAKEAQLNEARTAVEEYALKAPADGTVLRVMVGRGDVVGAQAKHPAVIFCPGGRRIVRAEVEQEFARSLAIGQAASIRDDSNGEGNWTGHVIRISDWYTQRRSVMPEALQYNDAHAGMHHRAGCGPTGTPHWPAREGNTAARDRFTDAVSGGLLLWRGPTRLQVGS